MIKVLIVDDEPKLREGLRSLIPWEQMGFTVVATAANGLQALEKYHTYNPELIVVDIRMPGMDGLELISELRNEGSSCHVLILSGHADFDYAKRAIAHRIDGYLLKPVDEQEMIQYLEQVRDTIEQEDRYSRWNEEEPARNREVLLRSLLVPAAGEDGELDLQKNVAALGLDSGRSYEIVLIEPREMGKSSEDKTAKVKADLEQYFSQRESGLFFSISPYMGILLDEPLLHEEDRDRLFNELSIIMDKEDFKFSAATGGAVSQPEAAHESYAAAQKLLRQAFFFKKDTINSQNLQSSAKELGELGTQEEVRENAETRLLLAVETGSTTVIQALVKEKIDELMAEGSDEQRIKETFVHLLSTVLARLEPAYPEIRKQAADHSPPIGELYHSYYLSDLQEQAAAFLEEIAEQMNSGGRGNEIKKIMEIIQRRYNENLKLETLSELFNYNSAYLGKMFKSSTGEYFNTYIDKVRIEKAKQFLAQGMKVYEVAEKVGYMNPDYFNAKFRKYVGVSPTSYRKST